MSAQAVGGVVEHNPIGIIIPPPLGRMAVLLVMGEVFCGRNGC